MQENQSHCVALCANAIPPHLPLFRSLSLSPWCSPVTGSMSPGSASQILARKKRRGVSGLQPWILIFSVLLGFLFFFGLPWLSLCSSSSVDHREEAQRPDQPQPVRAQEAGAQCFRETGNSSRSKGRINTTVSVTEMINRLHKLRRNWFMMLLIFPAGFIKAGESRNPADDCGPPQTPACYGRKRWDLWVCCMKKKKNTF